MPLIFRAAGPADAPELAALHVSTWREAYSHLLPTDFFTDEYIEGRQKIWSHVLNNPRAAAFYLRNAFEFDGGEQIDPGAPKIIDARMVR